jgi:hypothetical protein
MPASFDVALDRLSADARLTAEEHLSDLTFDETQALVRKLGGVDDSAAISAAFSAAYEAGTLNRKNDVGRRQDEVHGSIIGPEDLKAMLSKIFPHQGPEQIAAAVEEASKNGDLSAAPAIPSWKETCEAERRQIGIPGM